MARIRFGRLAASLFMAGAVASSLSGCVLVPVPAPVVAAPRVIVAPSTRVRSQTGVRLLPPVLWTRLWLDPLR
jgi:hypothetical protein